MTYKDLVLTLLKSREGLVCVEDHLLNDFRENGNPSGSFAQWCKEHSIACQRIDEDSLPKLRLQKALYKLS